MMQSGHCPLYAANLRTKSQETYGYVNVQSNLNSFNSVAVACG